MTDSLCLVIPMGTPYPALETRVRFHQILFNNLALCKNVCFWRPGLQILFFKSILGKILCPFFYSTFIKLNKISVTRNWIIVLFLSCYIAQM